MSDSREQPTVAPPRAARPGLLRRLAVVAYDGLLLFVVLYIATAVLLPFHGGRAIPPGEHLYTLYLLAISYAYLGWCWTHGGRTLGMRAWRVRIETRTGVRPGWGRSLLRFAVALVSWAAFGAGFLWIAVDRDRQAWHDRASGTVLVKEPPPPKRARGNAAAPPARTPPESRASTT